MSRPSQRAPDPKIFKAIEALRANRPGEAIRLLDIVCQKNRRDPQLWFLLSSAYSQQGKVQEVIRYTQQVLQLLPHHVGALCNLGGAYTTTGQHQQAARCFQEALRHAPHDHLVHIGLAEAMSMAGNMSGAITHFNVALRLRPDLAQAHKSLGQIHWSVGHLELAEQHYKIACQIDGEDVDAICGYVSVVGLAGRMDEARAFLDKALAKAPNDPDLLAIKAHELEREGHYEQAFAVVRDLTGQGAITPVSATTLARLCRRFDCCDQALAAVKDLLEKTSLDAPSRKLLGFAAGDLLDKLGRYDEAFAYFRQANEAMPLHFNYDLHQQYNNSMIETFSAARLPMLPRAGNADQRPIFIVGMPRSGTSLVEQILASHPGVHGAGELGDIITLANGLQDAGGQRYPTALANIIPAELDRMAAAYLEKLDSLAPAALRITDKMPQNFIHLGLIHLLFSKATIIHCKRHPLDTCLSVYFQNFSWGYDFAAELENIGLYYRQYARLMAHWQEVLPISILDVQYEELVANQEQETRRILAHCGLTWQDACLNFHETKRNVITASYDQVRKKMYAGSVGRWRHYEAHIEPLQRTLAPLLGADG